MHVPDGEVTAPARRGRLDVRHPASSSPQCRSGKYIPQLAGLPYRSTLSALNLTPGDSLRRYYALPLVSLLLTVACSGTPRDDDDADASMTADATDEQLVFWASLESLCGEAFEGRLVESVPPDESFEGQRIIMHVRECKIGEIRIPFFVGDDRSRSWVVTTTGDGLRLKHDHRHEDGTEDAVTQYGGETQGRGTGTAQDFYADAFTAELVPTAATNVWTIEVEPGRIFAYALRREGSDRRFRVEFDLTRPIDPPPPPWGS